MQRINYQDIPKGMFDTIMITENFINNSSLGMQLLELIRVRVSQNNGCAYCVDMHHKELQNLEETDLRLSSICVWKETPYFSDKERAALTLTDALTVSSGTAISDKIYKSLENHFNKEEVCFLTLAIAQINTWTCLMKTFKFTPGNYQVQK